MRNSTPNTKELNLVKQCAQDYGANKEQWVHAGKATYSMSAILNTVRTIIHHQYELPKEEDGTDKIFIPLATWLREVILRNVDLDTKDIQVMSNTASDGVTDLIRRMIKKYNKDHRMATFINDVADMLVTTGTVVIKTINGLKVLDTNKLVKLGIEDIQTSGIMEVKKVHYSVLLKQKKNWKNFKEIEDRARELMEDGKTPEITIYERWGTFIDAGKIKRGVIITSDADKSGEPSVYHFSQVKEKYPYLEAHQETMPGRWHGRGTPEKVIGLQELINEQANLKRQADKLTSTGLYIYQTGSPELEQGVLDQIKTGGVLTIGTNESFTELAQRPKITEYASAEQSISEWARRITGGSEVSSGEQLPSSMTATSAAIQQKSANTTFDLIREKMGILLDELYEDYILPEISKNAKRGDIIQLEATLENDKIMASMIEKQSQGKISAKDALTKIQEQGKTREVELIADYFKNVKYRVNVYITTEEVDKASMLSNINQLLLTYSQIAPGMLNGEKLITDTLDLLGLDGSKYINAQSNGSNNQKQGNATGQGQRQQAGAPGGSPQA